MGEKKKRREEEGEEAANSSPEEKMEGVREDEGGEGTVDREELGVRRRAGEGGKQEI